MPMTLHPTPGQRLQRRAGDAGPGLRRHRDRRAGGEDQFLEPEKAFRLSVRAADERHVEVLFQITPNYYMYRERFELKSPDATLGPVVMPQGKVKFDETFQKDVETYRDELRVRDPGGKSARSASRSMW